MILPALTIIQPFAHLIWQGRKRIENRRWSTSHRGRLVIHAGVANRYLSTPVSEMAREYGIDPAMMKLGEVIAVVDLVDCLKIADVRAGRVPAGLEWTQHHDHAEGPWCWILDNVRCLRRPFAVKGAQKIWKCEMEPAVIRSARPPAQPRRTA